MLRLKCFLWSGRLYRVTGSSMEPTLFAGDVVLVTKTGYDLDRGRLVIVRWPTVQGTDWTTALIKRVVGLPGDVIEFYEGSLQINGKYYPEPYLSGLPQFLGMESGRWELREGEMFLLGDNRAHSDDSRTYGPAPAETVEGTVEARVWPPSRWGGLP